jgi:4-hydroxythreonine-4-phosphate dehydrogenase
MSRPAIAITIGDAAGIGPEIALKVVAEPAIIDCCHPVVIGQRDLLARVAAQLKLKLPADVMEPERVDFSAQDIVPGKVQAACGRAAVACIDAAIAGCKSGRFAAMVTAPINKSALHAAGIPFPGHTELLADRLGVKDEAMMLYHRDLAVALVTCHQSLASVAKSLTPLRIVRVGQLLHDALKRIRGAKPRLAVCGLNPHAGEDGLFGNEDSERIMPAVGELLQLGIDADGPLPPDAAFIPANRAKYDGYVCMYHDQGLIPFKALAFDEGVNVTLGLPIIRTSVDHGTAFDLAWQGRAAHQSLVSAIQLAAQLAIK